MSENEKTRTIYAQGDVVIEKIDALPEGMVKSGNVLKVRGSTGNNHVLRAEVYENYKGRYVVVKRKANLTHPQHPPRAIPAGVYEVRGIRDHERPRDYSD